MSDSSQKLQEHYQQIRRYIDNASPRIRFLILIASVVVIFALWHFLFRVPLDTKEAKLVVQERTVHTQLKVLEDEAELIVAEAEKPQLQAQKHKELQQEITKLETNLGIFSEQMVVETKLIDMFKDLLAKERGLTWVGFNTLPSKPLDPSEGMVVVGGGTMFEHGLEIAFRGNYFDTLDYLKQLEKAGYQIFWNSLDYEVLNYPEAKITLSISVLSKNPYIESGFIEKSVKEAKGKSI